ncbi:hypothetical protein UF10_01810 [Peptostreptococcus russellii]|uniref:Uncharacterized protein n=1 Tax=Peptostreptococcus russellii TaxID=215200 RepID=A0A2P7Q2E8_9FIRM|nr:hypothetical protein [Peptostreptococcus russellii]PSJ32143.1 hypothetical protein UF10_01810 [Peptostreptococcus russellii]
MDYMEIKQQVVTEIKDLLREIEPAVIATITESVKSEYEQTLYEQKLEICDLQKRVKTLEESISWAAYKLGTEI